MSNLDLPAYPGKDAKFFDKDTNSVIQLDNYGLTKLEAFTMAALQGLCANPSFSLGDGGISVGHAAVCAAEAALAELEVKTP